MGEEGLRMRLYMGTWLQEPNLEHLLKSPAIVPVEFLHHGYKMRCVLVRYSLLSLTWEQRKRDHIEY